MKALERVAHPARRLLAGSNSPVDGVFRLVAAEGAGTYRVGEMLARGGMGLRNALDALADSCADCFARSLAWVLELATSATESGRYAELREDRIALLFEALDPAEVVERSSFFQTFFDRLHPCPELASRAVVEHVIAANGRRSGFRSVHERRSGEFCAGIRQERGQVPEPLAVFEKRLRVFEL